jgi:hypothetical protein
MDETALFQRAEEIGFEFGHGLSLLPECFGRDGAAGDNFPADRRAFSTVSPHNHFKSDSGADA